MIRIYISGRIGGDTIDEETRDKFHEAELHLQSLGFDVVNPTDDYTQGFIRGYACQLDVPFYTAALLYDLQDIASCEAVYFLKDWHLSPGSRTEFAFAKAVGKQLYFEASEPLSYRAASRDLFDE